MAKRVLGLNTGNLFILRFSRSPQAEDSLPPQLLVAAQFRCHLLPLLSIISSKQAVVPYRFRSNAVYLGNLFLSRGNERAALLLFFFHEAADGSSPFRQIQSLFAFLHRNNGGGIMELLILFSKYTRRLYLRDYQDNSQKRVSSYFVPSRLSMTGSRTKMGWSEDCTKESSLLLQRE